jgi:hypothetical protein
MKNVEISSLDTDNALTEGLSKSLTTKSADNAVRNSLIAGSVAGVMSTIAVHPFDVLRVKMQSSAPATMTSASNTTTKILGLRGTLRNTLRSGGGLRALYTGLAMPLAAQAVYKGTIFTVNNMTESFIRDWKTETNHLGGFEAPYKLTLTDRFISGFMGGAINAALFCTPVEYVRNQQIAQIENSRNGSSTAPDKTNRNKSAGILHSRNKNGPIAVIRRTIQGNGFAGLWRGVGSTVLRDSVGCGFFFAAMAYSQEQLTPAHSNRPPQMALLILSGALAGVSFWLWALPVDTMKTWIQNGTARNLSDAVRISQRNGFAQSIPSLFRGWQVAYSRGAPSAAITVLTYSLVFQHLQASP